MRKIYFLLPLCIFCSFTQAQWTLSGPGGNRVFRYNVLKIPIVGAPKYWWNSNTALGFGALGVISTGLNNTAVGEFALENTTSGSNNSSFGVYANNNGNGSSNQAFGYQSLDVNASSFNNAFGAYALLNNTYGMENVAVGDSAMYINTTGSYNTAVGSYAGPSSGNTGLTNSGAFGYQATYTASNEIIIGSSAVTLIGGFAAWTSFSDGRFKRNIKENVPGLTFINQLRPVTYNLDVESINNVIRPGQPRSGIDQAAMEQKSAIVYSGFVAQEVLATAKKMGYEFSGVATPQNDKDFYGLRYSEFVMPLVKAVQELSNTNDSLRTTVANLQAQINSVVQQLNNLKATALSGTTPSLQQNAPNPFNSTTLINYYLPRTTRNAQLTITDASGRVLKDVVLNKSMGPGQAVINAGELASGSYFYSLVVNGKNVATRQMVLTR